MPQCASAWLSASGRFARACACACASTSPAGSDPGPAPSAGPAPADASAGDAAACVGPRTLTCVYFDGTTRSWSTEPPTVVSIGAACGPGGSHGEIDAYVTTASQYWLDRIGFSASGSAVRIESLGASDDAGGQTYGCDAGGGKVFTQLLCGRDVGPGTLALRFEFAGRWSDGTAWTRECDSTVQVLP
jgi:hypothetical protein